MISSNLLRDSLVVLCGLAFLARSNSRAADNATPANKFNVVAFCNAAYDATHINFVDQANLWLPKMGINHGFTYTATNNWKNLNEGGD